MRLRCWLKGHLSAHPVRDQTVLIGTGYRCVRCGAEFMLALSPLELEVAEYCRMTARAYAGHKWALSQEGSLPPAHPLHEPPKYNWRRARWKNRYWRLRTWWGRR